MHVEWLKTCYKTGGCALGFLVDFVKAWAIYNYGGIWLDVDTELVGQLDQLEGERGFVIRIMKLAR